MKIMDKLAQKRNYGTEIAGYMRKKLSDEAFSNFEHCGDYLTMLEDLSREKKKIETGFFCKQRFCPGCAWRKAMADALCVATICEASRERTKSVMLMATLTVPNVSGKNLREQIHALYESFHRLMRRKRYRVWKDHIRKLEVTYNAKRDDYHPHLHVIVLVSPRYFNTKDYDLYITRDQLLEDWRKATGDLSITQVDVRRCRTSESGSNAILEVSKYVAKASDYSISEEVFDTFYRSLYRMNTMTYSGICRDLRTEYRRSELDRYIEKDDTKYVWRVVYTWCSSVSHYEEIEIKEHVIEREIESCEEIKLNLAVIKTWDELCE